MRLKSISAIVLLSAAMLGCPSSSYIPCNDDSNCNLSAGGMCLAGPSSNSWCAYPDPACPSGYRFSDKDVGDGVSGNCVATSDAGIDAGPADAPVDGDTTARCRIAFEDGASFGVRDREVWIANVDGTGFVNVSNSPADDFEPTWAPSGQKLAFASNRRGIADNNRDKYDIFVVNIDGTGLTNITANGAGSSSSSRPKWSPDGTRIAYVYNLTQLWVMNADGSGAAQLSTLQLIDFIEWSADGTKIAFNHFESQGLIIPTIVVVTVGDGSEPVKLTASSGPERAASWAPAARIAFEGSNGDIFTANADGSAPVNVTNSPADANRNPAWIDNGNNLAFNKSATGHAEVWTIPATGGTGRNLTQNNTGNDFISDASPRGLIAFERHESLDASQVGIVNFDTGDIVTFNSPGGVNSTSGVFSPCP